MTSLNEEYFTKIIQEKEEKIEELEEIIEEYKEI
jgi:hypothetical protein